MFLYNIIFIFLNNYSFGHFLIPQYLPVPACDADHKAKQEFSIITDNTTNTINFILF